MCHYFIKFNNTNRFLKKNLTAKKIVRQRGNTARQSATNLFSGVREYECLLQPKAISSNSKFLSVYLQGNKFCE